MAHKYDTSDFRNGLKILVDRAPYQMVYFQFVKPGKGTAFTRTKLKNMITGSVIERTYRTGEKVEAAEIEEANMQFLYEDGEFHHFMNTEDYSQVQIPSDAIESEAKFLTENLTVDILFFEGKAISVGLPNFIESKITYCEPAVRGDTATNVTKPATLETGAIVQVPLFINDGDTVKVDTRSGTYLERTAIG